MYGKNHVAGGIALAGITIGGLECLLKSSESFENIFGPAIRVMPGLLFPNDYGSVLQFVLGFVAICGFIVGSIAPDMDHPNSMIGRYVYIPVGHRGILHSIWPVLICILIGLSKPYCRPFLLFSAGYLAHLICDAFSASGVRLFWPCRFGKHRLKLYVTGETSELVFLIIILILAFMLMVGGFFVL